MTVETKFSREDLAFLQELPLGVKIETTQRLIAEFLDEVGGAAFVSVSGGKDSTVLAHLVAKMVDDVDFVFIDTGVELPGVRELARRIANVVLHPKMRFKDVASIYGYPAVSKEVSRALHRYRETGDPVQKYRRLHGWPSGKKGMIPLKWQFLIDAPFKCSARCCSILKRYPIDAYRRKSHRYSISAVMAEESRSRTLNWLRHGCNFIEGATEPRCWPMAFWTDEDVWAYIDDENLAYAPEYDMGYNRTGCAYCGFGLHLEEPPNRFQLLAETHPRMHRYAMEVLDLRRVLEYVHPGIDLG